MTGWRIDIKSETQILDEENAYADGDWAEGEWVTDPETGEQTWVPADGSEAMSADDWATAAEEAEANSEDPSIETSPIEDAGSTEGDEEDAPDSENVDNLEPESTDHDEKTEEVGEEEAIN